MADPADPRITEALVNLADFRDAEMSRVARVLHDEVGQVLSAAGLQLDVLRMDFHEQTPEIASRTAEIQKMIERAIDRLRDLSYELNPATVERAGLHFALKRLSNRIEASFQGSVRLTLDPALRMPPQVARRVFQIVECAVNNAARHAGATQIDILARPSEGSIIAEVVDNGRGFSVSDAAAAFNGFGLAFMRMYARLGGLNLTIDRTEKGTRVRVSYSAAQLPVREAKGASA